MTIATLVIVVHIDRLSRDSAEKSLNTPGPCYCDCEI